MSTDPSSSDQRSGADAVLDHDERLTKPAEFAREPQPWGELTWMVSGALGSSDRLTVGRCRIAPGQANPRHLHPNCDEVLLVVRGTIEHSIGDRRFSMSAGDIVSIPRGSFHNATNVGDDDAEFVIIFDTPDRQTVGE